MKILRSIAGSFFVFSLGASAAQMKVKVALSPAGSFEAISSNVEGSAKKVGEEYTAAKLLVKVKDLKTGVDLRDDHMQNKYLEAEKFPDIVLTNAQGKAGKFSADIEIRGVKKKVEGTYVAEASTLRPKFSVKMSEFTIPKAKYMGIGAKDEVQIEGEVPLTK